MTELPAAVMAEAFPADPDFPQLRVASDPARMLRVFRTHLTPLPGKPCVIEDCVPFRFRCRQATSRCVLQYTLRLADPATGRRWDQWVTGLVYAAQGAAERLWRELEAGGPRREIPEHWLTFEPVGFIPELQMVVVVFPFDRKLRNLPRVLAGALRELDPLVLNGLGPGRWRIEERRIEPTRYRTELGAALRYTLGASDGLTVRRETRRCYVKLYRNDRGADTFCLLSALSEKAGAGDGPYAVVKPLAYVGELRALVLEEARGTALQQILLADADPDAALAAVGRAVAALNQDDLPITRSHALADQLDDVKRAASLVQWACPDTRAEVRAITGAVIRGLVGAPPAPIHRDLKPDHIFVAAGRVTFIDFDSAALGDPVRDPAHLFAHLAARVGLDRIPRERARAAARTFAEAYFARVPAAWRERFALHCAGALIEVAGGIFKRQEPGWRENVTAAVEEAGRVLA